MTIRDTIDIDRVIQLLFNGVSYTDIGVILTNDYNIDVSRNVIAGIHRDLKSGVLRPSKAIPQDRGWVSTYVYGVETPERGAIPVFTGHPTIYGDAVVISDVHLPLTDYAFAETVVARGRFFGVRRLIIAGDLLDNASRNKFRRKTAPASFSKGLEMSRKLLQFYGEWFEEIWFEPGNHDDWFLEDMEGDLIFDDFAQLLVTDEVRSKFIATPYDRVTLISGDEPYTIPHQSEVSVYHLKVAEDLAFKFNTNMIIPHQHTTAQGFDRYNHYVLFAIGGLHEPDMQSYLQLKTSKRPSQQKGYAIVVDGQGFLISNDHRLTKPDQYMG